MYYINLSCYLQLYFCISIFVLSHILVTCIISDLAAAFSPQAWFECISCKIMLFRGRILVLHSAVLGLTSRREKSDWQEYFDVK